MHSQGLGGALENSQRTAPRSLCDRAPYPSLAVLLQLFLGQLLLGDVYGDLLELASELEGHLVVLADRRASVLADVERLIERRCSLCEGRAAHLRRRTEQLFVSR
jgi:hypothetical protein